MTDGGLLVELVELVELTEAEESVAAELPRVSSCFLYSHDFLSSSLTGRLVDTPRSSRRNLEGGL